jgi:nitrate reductase assembly molybdenum cofactor insertion protein NarJ
VLHRAGGADGARRVRERRAPTEPMIDRLHWLAVAAAFGLLTGCGTYGDFGRVRPSLVNDDTHAWMGPAAARGPATNLAWRHQLTEEERTLRDLAYPLIEPPYDRQRWYSVLGELGVGSRPWPYPDRSAYASRLFITAYRSQTARYNRLIEDIRNDVMRIDPFFSSARYVTEMDRKREKALAYVSNLTAEERDNTLQRIAENRNIVRWVQGSLHERTESYRVALERMVIAAPSPVAVEAERSLTLLQQRITGYGA